MQANPGYQDPVGETRRGRLPIFLGHAVPGCLFNSTDPRSSTGSDRVTVFEGDATYQRIYWRERIYQAHVTLQMDDQDVLQTSSWTMFF